MSTKFNNIDELFKAELGGTTAKAPASVKANIDKALGFGSRKYIWLFIPLAAILIGSIVFIPDWSGKTDAASTQLSEKGPNENFSSGSDVSDTDSENEKLEDATSESSKAAESSSDNGAGNKSSSLNASVSSDNNGSSSLNVTKGANSNERNGTNSQSNNSGTGNSSGNSSGASKSKITKKASNKGKSLKDQKSQSNHKGSNGSAKGSNSDDSEGIAAVGTKGKSNNSEEGTVGSKGKDQTKSSNDGLSGESTSSQNDEIKEGTSANKNSSESDLTTGQNEDKSSSKEQENTSNSEENSAEEGDETIVDKKADDETNTVENNKAGEENKTKEGADKENNVASSEEETGDAKEENQATEETAKDGIEEDIKDESSLVEIDKPKEKKKHWFVTAEGGPNITRSFYDATDVSEQDLYSSSMSDNIGSEFSMSANYRLNKGLMFGTGLGFSSFKETYDFVDEYWSHDSTSTTEIIYDSTAWPIDTITTWTYDSTFVSNFNEQGFNKASYLSIPLNLGVQIPWGKFRFDLLASFRYNILLKASGLHYNNGSFTAFTASSGDVYKRGYMDMVFAGNIHYNVFKNFFVTASVRYKPVFGNTYIGNSINRRFHYTHIGLGISLEL